MAMPLCAGTMLCTSPQTHEPPLGDLVIDRSKSVQTLDSDRGGLSETASGTALTSSGPRTPRP